MIHMSIFSRQKTEKYDTEIEATYKELDENRTVAAKSASTTGSPFRSSLWASVYHGGLSLKGKFNHTKRSNFGYSLFDLPPES